MTSGTTYTVTAGQLTGNPIMIVWRSATVGAKTTNIPASALANAGQEINVKVTQGDNTVHTITPASGTIEGAASLSFTDVPGAFHVNMPIVSDYLNTDWLVK